jgi:ABC-type phosphate transport system substrate-binding protein
MFSKNLLSCTQMDMIMDRAKLPTRLTYRAVGSTTGIAEFKGDGTNIFLPLNHFGSGDIPISTADYNELLAASVEIVHLPVVLGSISFFHSVPGVPQGDLDLTSCLIARILKRDITDWMHPDILADNPNLRELVGKDSLPIQVAHRVEGSSSTASITEVRCVDEYTYKVLSICVQTGFSPTSYTVPP